MRLSHLSKLSNLLEMVHSDEDGFFNEEKKEKLEDF